MKSRIARNLLFAAAGILSAVLPVKLHAQSSASPRPSFEVAVIKPNDSGSGAVEMSFEPGGRFVASNVLLKQLIQVAYKLQPFQVTGGQGWINSERYNVEARAESAVPEDQVRLMLQSLLEEHFQLKLHRDSKEVPVYALLVAKGGPKLEEVKDDGAGGQDVRMGRGQLRAGKTQMAQFANILSSAAGRTVVDKTGLNGFYNIKLEWTPDPAQGGASVERPGGAPEGGAAPDPGTPSIFTAVQEQLGLRLEAQKSNVDVYTIESAAKPEN